MNEFRVGRGMLALLAVTTFLWGALFVYGLMTDNELAVLQGIVFAINLATLIGWYLKYRKTQS